MVHTITPAPIRSHMGLIMTCCSRRLSPDRANDVGPDLGKRHGSSILATDEPEEIQRILHAAPSRRAKLYQYACNPFTNSVASCDLRDRVVVRSAKSLSA